MYNHPYNGPVVLCLLVLSSCQRTTDHEKQSIAPAAVHAPEQHTLPEAPPASGINTTSLPSFTRKPSEEITSPVFTREPFVSYAEFTPPQINGHLIEVSRDTVIHDGAGLSLEIPAGAFVDEEGGEPQGKVLFSLQSFHDNLSILKQGLTTTSNGEIIETAGMFYCDASAEGKKLLLRKPINVRLQATALKEGMQVFYGEMQEDSVLNWIPAADDRGRLEKTDVRKSASGAARRNVKGSRSNVSVESDRYKVSGYVWDVTSDNNRERLRQLDTDRPSQWTSKIYRDLLKADDLLWKTVFDLTTVQVTMRLLENARYELVVNPSDNRVLDSLIRLSTKNYWDKEKYPRHVNEDDQIRYTSTFYLRLWKTREDYLHAQRVEKNKRAEYWSKLKSKGDQQTATAADANELSVMSSYALQITRMGWINCDRFVNLPRVEDVVVSLPSGFKGTVQLALGSVRSFLPGSRATDRILFRGLPAGEKFTLIWFDSGKNGELLMARQNCVADGSPVPAPVYKKVTMGELKAEMASL